MSSLAGLNFKEVYFSPKDNVVFDFFIPALKNCDSYSRAAGYFTSSSLVELSVGICDLVKRGGKIRVITSPRLNRDDVAAIQKGYDLKETTGKAMVRDFEKPDDIESLDRLSLLSELIARGYLEIKVAIMRNVNQYPDSIFHPKFGIMADSDGKKIAFSGSMNESKNALLANWDTVEVSSYGSNPSRTKIYETEFENLWNNNDDSVVVIEMPKVVHDLLDSYRTGELNLDLDECLLNKFEKYQEKESVYFRSPEWLEIRPYQIEAINKWIDNEYHGIFDMATGTGKTKTALCALEKLYNAKPNEGIFTIIVAPQKHLVNQWGDEVQNYGVNPIIGHSDSLHGQWKDKFRRQILLSKSSPRNSCLITTISSFSTKEIQDWISKIPSLALVIDEAHNMGSDNRLGKLPANAKYRLALSATMERYKDKIGTDSLKEYFGEYCISYSLDDAIGTYLTNYLYYPVSCSYNSVEYEQFVRSNEELDAVLSNPYSSKTEKMKAKNEYIEYSYTLNSKMDSKYEALERLMMKFVSSDHFLVYCGKARVDDQGDFIDSSHNECLKSIDKTARILGMNGLGLKISRITYRESAQERKRILEEFDRGETAGIIAISCLDEGVDIPSIKTAVIMTSSDNPREYIQRRGRVLRIHPGKEYATIYDFVVIPKQLKDVVPGDEHSGLELKMIAKEIRRMKEFSKVSMNPEDTEKMFTEISNSYDISIDEILETYGEDYEQYRSE